MPILGQTSRNDQHCEGSTALLCSARPAQYDAYDTVTTGHQLKTDWSRSNGPWQVRVVSWPEKSYEHSGRNMEGILVAFFVPHDGIKKSLNRVSIRFTCGLVDFASISVTFEAEYASRGKMCVSYICVFILDYSDQAGLSIL